MVYAMHHTNWFIDRKHMIILVGAEKAFNKIPFIIQVLEKLGIQRMYQHNKSHI